MSEDTFSKRLLAWYDHHGRKDLPWQRDPSPYRVWVSEIMLQQTRVNSVIPYYERFMRRFPDVATLAAASEDEVLHLWSGLGYYSRARNLHQAAQTIRDQFGGCFPEEPEAIQSLPGIGRSTAGAILSLAMNRPFAILDGNVKRVLARCFAVEGWPGKGKVQKELWGLAEERLPEQRSRAYNQALMDLGATVCSRSKPQCDACPLATLCEAHQRGAPEAYPASKPRKPLPQRAVRLLIIQNREGGLLLEKRPSQGVWGGLWSLPECPVEQDPLAWCGGQLDVTGAQAHSWPPFRHTFSHFHLDIEPVEIRLQREQETRIPHHPSTADAESLAVTGRTPSSRFGVVSTTPSPSSSPCTPSQRRFDALVTNGGEECGLRIMDGDRRVWYKIMDPDARGLAAPVARIIDELQQREKKT